RTRSSIVARGSRWEAVFQRYCGYRYRPRCPCVWGRDFSAEKSLPFAPSRSRDPKRMGISVLLPELFLQLRHALRRFHGRVRIERHTLYPLLHEKFCEFRNVGRALAADAAVFAQAVARSDGLRDERAYGQIIFIGQMCERARVAVDAYRELREVVG